jgi:hypothetical protein
MCVRGSACPNSANLIAYARVSIKDFWHDGAPTQAEIADQGEDASSMNPAATSSGNRPAAPGNTSPRDGVITTRPAAEAASMVAACAGVNEPSGT